MADDAATEPDGGTHHPRELGLGRQLSFLGGLVLVLVLLGVAVGLAGRFSIAYVIRIFDAGGNPTGNQFVGLTFLVSIFVLLMGALVLSAGIGLLTGRKLVRPGRGAAIAGGACLVGVPVFAILTIILMASPLAGGGGGGGGNGGLPIGAVLNTALLAAGIGAATAFVVARA